MNDTIADFGDQWTRYRDNDGYYASAAMFADICGPLMNPSEVAEKRCADLGSGTGRIVGMLLGAGAAHVTAVEPSDAFDVLRANTAGQADRITYIRGRADELTGGPFDLIVSFGVLHHIEDPAPAVARAFDQLAPGGRMLVWLYGHEGNEAYLRVAEPLRRMTRRLPDPVLVGVSHALTAPLSAYAFLCRFLPLPMRGYMRELIGRYGWRHRMLTVFDQLNPGYARYYREAEARALLTDAGFTDVRLYHRHGYSWTVIGTRASDAP